MPTNEDLLMATYKKRGYKPKAKKEKEQIPGEEEVYVEGESTTEEVFDTLDQGANRTEEWVSKNQKPIFIGIGVVVVAVLAYIGFDKFIQQPKEIEAANEMGQAQVYFENAQNSTSTMQDSLYNMALNGGAGKFGFLDITEAYSGTNAANLAHYYAGMSLLKTGKYKEAISQLESFKSEDQILSVLAKGAIGDAFMQLEQPKEALSYYEKAAAMQANGFTAPKYLLKSAIAAIQLNEGSTAVKHLEKIKEAYPNATEAEKVPAYLGQAKAMQ